MLDILQTDFQSLAEYNETTVETVLSHITPQVIETPLLVSLLHGHLTGVLRAFRHAAARRGKARISQGRVSTNTTKVGFHIQKALRPMTIPTL